MWSKGLACTFVAHRDWVILPFGEMPATGAMTGGYTPARDDLDRFDAALQTALPRHFFCRDLEPTGVVERNGEA